MIILTSPISAASPSTLVVDFSGLTAPAAWGAPLPTPGSPNPGPGQFPPPPLLVAVIPIDGEMMTGQGAVQHGTLVELLVLMTDPTTHLPTLSLFGNSTTATFQVDSRLTTASLSATVQGIDLLTMSTKTVTITLSWSAIDPLTGTLSPILRSTMESHFSAGGFSLILHENMQMRVATASGMLTIAGGPTIPLPPDPAAIARANIGTVTKIPLL